MAHFHVRKLPHLHQIHCPAFITWRVHGSLPVNRRFSKSIDSGETFLLMDRILAENNFGPLYLQRNDIAQMIVGAIEYRNPSQYMLHSFVVMPNHVHILITPKTSVTGIMRSLKRFTARRANQMPGLTGMPFCQDESYDRLVRDASEFDRIKRYIEMNPVHAGLVAEPERFPWSSAWPIDNRPHAASLPHTT